MTFLVIKSFKFSNRLIISLCINVVKKLFSVNLAVSSCTVLALLQNTVGGAYNPFHSLPLWFSLGIGFIFISYALFWNFLFKGDGIVLSAFFFHAAY